MTALIAHGRLVLAVLATGLLGCVLLGVGIALSRPAVTGSGAMLLGAGLVLGHWVLHRLIIRKADAARADLQTATRRAVALISTQQVAAVRGLATRTDTDELSVALEHLADAVRADPGSSGPGASHVAATVPEGPAAAQDRSLERLLMLLVLSSRSRGGHR